MQQYIIMDQRVDEADERFETLLRKAYEEGVRPVCLCKTTGVPMYVSRTGEALYLKRMPLSGGSHSPECDRFEVPASISGKSELLGQAIIESDSDNVAIVKLGFPIMSGTSRAAPTRSSLEASSVKATPTRLTMRALLDYLWDEAELNLLAPAFVGRRYWGHVQKFLRNAAVGKSTSKIAFENLLYIPEVFTVERKEEIAASRRRLLDASTQDKHKMVIIGSMKALEDTRLGGKLSILHAPGFPLFLDVGLYKKVKNRFRNETELWGSLDGTHLMVISTFLATDSGVGKIEELAVMNVTAEWIPFSNLVEYELLDILAKTKRRFVRSMHYNLENKVPLAFGILLDAGEDGTPMFICPGDATEAEVAAYQSIIEETGIPSWFWHTHQPMPPLPVARSNRH